MKVFPTGIKQRCMRRWSKSAAVGLVCLLPLLAACKEKTDAVGIRAYNHTDNVVGQFQINGGSGGSFVVPHGSGGLTCCAVIPAKWRRGLQVTVRWSDGHFNNEQERTVSIPEYDNRGTDLVVHFLRSGEIKVFVTGYLLGHPDYPLKGEEAELTPGVSPQSMWGD